MTGFWDFRARLDDWYYRTFRWFENCVEKMIIISPDLSLNDPLFKAPVLSDPPRMVPAAVEPPVEPLKSESRPMAPGFDRELAVMRAHLAELDRRYPHLAEGKP